MLSLAGAAGAGRGVDSTASAEQALPTARELAGRTGAVVAVSGQIDYITDGDAVIEVHTGHRLMTQVTGVGCALGAMVAACCAVQPALQAAASATSLLTVAAERAAAASAGPGTFAVLLLDELAGLEHQTLLTAVRPVRRPIDLSLYLVADSALCGARGLVPTVRAAVAGGVTAVQLREPGATTRQLCRLGSALQEVLVDAGVPLIVNDRLDVALAIRATGVHLGQNDLAVSTARRLGGDDLVIGLSVSTDEQVAEADALDPGVVDHLGVGPVFATSTKPDAAAALGLVATAALAASTRLPCVAIGGIGLDNVAAVRATGVAGVAVVSAICAAEDPRAAAAQLRSAQIGAAS